MRVPRYTIRSLLGVVLFVAVAVAALRASTDAWDSGVLGLALLILLTAILLAVHRTDRKRAYWLGFALFGWAYLVASLIPPLESRLPTTRGLAYLGAARPVAIPQGVAVADFDSDGQVDLLLTNASDPSVVYLNNGDGTFRLPTSTNATQGGNPAPSFVLWNRLMGTGGSPENFVRIGHSILALVFASFGGSLSRRLCRLDIPRPRDDPSLLKPEEAMRLPRYTIRSLLGVVLFVAIAVASLRAADDVWDGCLLALTSLCLLTSVLLVVHRIDRRRAFWLGFALFGWAYLVASLIPPIGSRLPTTMGLAFIDSKIPGREITISAVFAYTSTASTNPVKGFVVPPQGNAAVPSPPAISTPIVFRLLSATTGRLLAGPGGTTENFIRIGHSLLALVLAFLGGHLSRHLYDRGREDRSNPPSDPPASA